MASKTKQYDIQTTTYKTAGTASAYELTIPKLTSLVDELTFVVEFHIENDASATLDINSLGAIAIMTSEGNAVDAGDLKTTGRYTLVYDSNDNSFIVNQMVDSEIHNIVGGNGTIIPGFNEPTSTHTMQAGETITAGQHTTKGIYPGVSINVTGEDLQTWVAPAVGAGTTPINFGQAFIREVDGNMTTLTTKRRGINYGSTNVRIDWQITAKLYAIAGTYGVDAVPTGSILYSSAMTAGSLTNQISSHANFDQVYTFNQNIPQGTYIVMLEGVLWTNYSHNAGGGGEIRLLGDFTGASYLGNTIDDTTAIAGQNIYGVFESDEELAYISDATTSDGANRQGQATETKNIGENILLKKQGEINQTGAINDGEVRYLSDIPGELSLTPGTNVRMIAQGSGVDKVWMGRSQHKSPINLTPGATYYTNTQGIAEGSFTGVDSGLQNGTIVEIQISTDNVTFYPIQEVGISYSGIGNMQRAAQAIIPAGVYFKVIFSGGGVSQTNHRCRFRPIK